MGVLHQQSGRHAQVRLRSIRALTPVMAPINPPATRVHRLMSRDGTPLVWRQTGVGMEPSIDRLSAGPALVC